MIYRFGRYSLDDELLELSQDSEPVAVEPQVFSVLVFLIENRDRVVGKDELIEAVWDGRIVSDSTLNSRINAARRAIGDTGSDQRVIKTFPRRGFRFVLDVIEGAAGETPALGAGSISQKPSIAVLPFENLSGDLEQEYFSDGITGDIITALSRIRKFFVIARGTTFTYKGQAVNVQVIAKDLGVRYVLEGNVRKAGNRVRISAQLIDGDTGNHLWAERYDRELEDIFAVQDELTEVVIGAIAPQVGKAEQQRARLKPPDNLDAWDLYQRGMWHHNRRWSKEDNVEARALFKRATEVDPQFGPAYSGYVWSCMRNTLFGFEEGFSGHALRAAQVAVELDTGDAMAHHALGAVHYMNRDHEAAIPEFELAISLDPSFATAYHFLGSALVNSGRAREALAPVHTAIRLSPHDDGFGAFHARLALAHLFLKEYDQAVEWGRKAIRLGGIQWPVHVFLTSALGHLGHNEDAKQALDGLVEILPGITYAFVRQHLTTTNTDDMDHLLDGLRKAGLSE